MIEQTEIVEVYEIRLSDSEVPYYLSDAAETVALVESNGSMPFSIKRRKLTMNEIELHPYRIFKDGQLHTNVPDVIVR